MALFCFASREGLLYETPAKVLEQCIDEIWNLRKMNYPSGKSVWRQYFWELEETIWHGRLFFMAIWKKWGLACFLFSFFFVRQSRSKLPENPLKSQNCASRQDKKKSSPHFFDIGMKTNHTKFCFPNLKNHGAEFRSQNVSRVAETRSYHRRPLRTQTCRHADLAHDAVTATRVCVAKYQLSNNTKGGSDFTS